MLKKSEIRDIIQTTVKNIIKNKKIKICSLVKFIVSSKRKFNIMITNENKTEIAPTYTIINTMAKNSIPKLINKNEVSIYTKISEKIAKTGLLDNIINNTNKIIIIFITNKFIPWYNV